uniref:Uncharacterized protein n=1 Tax=Schistocephalus solidus TaxID=70667 RepID=A0A0X3P5Q9_SCHSO
MKYDKDKLGRDAHGIYVKREPYNLVFDKNRMGRKLSVFSTSLLILDQSPVHLQSENFTNIITKLIRYCYIHAITRDLNVHVFGISGFLRKTVGKPNLCGFD